MKGTSQETWEGDYWKVLKFLPLDASLTAEVLEQLIERTQPNTKSRKRACMAVGAIAKLAKLDYDPAPYAGKYGLKSVTPRDLIDDEVIVAWRDRIKNPGWRWFYGLVATYGLRPHEAFRIDFDRLRGGNPVLAVENETKTGFRLVWAFHPEWVEQFDLQNVTLPRVNLERTNTKVGASATNYFKETAQTPFRLYTLRHCWAVRTIFYGLPDALAAQQMGHSTDVHQRIYHRWINEKHHQGMYDTLILKTDRPQPPKTLETGKDKLSNQNPPIKSPASDRDLRGF